MKFKGYLLAAIAAATYGTNPAFAIPLYADGMNPNSVLLFRYLLGLPLLVALLFYRGRNLRLMAKEILPVATLGILMAISSLTLFESYNHINSGIASTLLFVYPILVALLMIFFFREKFKLMTAVCLLLMSCGLVLLIHDESGTTLNSYGLLLVMASALTYAVCLVMINVSVTLRSIPTIKLTFYILLSGSAVFVIVALFGTPLMLPSQWYGWGNLFALALLPTIISLLCTTIAIQIIGSTPTAILGALEPVTAVVLSVIVLDQGITEREIFGGLLIIVATTLVIAGDRMQMILLHVRKMFPSLRRQSPAKDR